MLAADLDALAPAAGSATRLLGPFDLFLQAKDRRLLVAEQAQAKALWPVLGRPGAVLCGGELLGTWRPRKSGSNLALRVHLWTEPSAAVRRAIAEQAERLSAYRGLRLRGIEYA